MRKKKNVNKGAIIIKVDKRLDEYLDKGYFKEKLEIANKILKESPLPKQK